MFKHILVPLDGSTFSEAALTYATNLAQKFSAELLLVYVMDQSYVQLAAELPNLYTQFHLAQREQYTIYLTEQVENLLAQGIQAQWELVDKGGVSASIIDLATEKGCDLIVMSTHGRAGMQRFMFGSVAERVVRHARVPVLLIRPEAVTESAPA